MQVLSPRALRQQGHNDTLSSAFGPSLSSGPEDARKETNVWEKAVWTDGRDLYNGRDRGFYAIEH